MADAQKLFSIERRRPTNANSLKAGGEGPATAADVQRVLDAIDILERKIGSGVVAEASRETAEDKERKTKIDMIENEVAEISGRIRATKAEIAALRHPLAEEDKFASATLELGAIVEQTESATEKIMEAAEKIEESAGELMSRQLTDFDNAIVGDIVDEVTKVYEACNFQDLTGQRITKVVRVLNFIEERVESMMNTWNVKEFETMPLPPDVVQRDGDLEMHGPGETTADASITQDEIDKLFD